MRSAFCFAFLVFCSTLWVFCSAFRFSVGYSFMLRSRNQTTNQIPRSYKNDRFDWPFDLVIVTWKNNLSVAAFQRPTSRVLVLPMRSSIFLLRWINCEISFAIASIVTFLHKIVRSYKNCTIHLLLSLCFAVIGLVLVESVLKARHLSLEYLSIEFRAFY